MMLLYVHSKMFFITHFISKKKMKTQKRYNRGTIYYLNYYYYYYLCGKYSVNKIIIICPHEFSHDFEF